MSLWADDPEYFDNWILELAADGKFGPELQQKALEGEIEGDELWAMKDIDPKGELGSKAMEDYVERWME